MFENLPYGVCVVDSTFRIVHLNPAALPAFGEIPGGIIGRDFGDIMHVIWEKAYADEIVTAFRHTLETGSQYVEAERAERRADRGVVEIYEWRVDRLATGDGHAVVCYFRDVGETVRARERLREQEATSRRRAEALVRLHALSERGARLDVPVGEYLEHVLDTAMWMMGCTRGTLQLYDQAAGVLRIAAHRGLPERFLEFFAEVREGDASACGAALEARAALTIEDVEASPIVAGSPALDVFLDAGVRAVHSTPLKSGTGQLLGMISTHAAEPRRPGELELGILDLLARQAADVLERRRSEQSAREISQELQLVTETMAALVARCSRDLRYVWVSKPYAEMLRRPMAEITGRSIVEILGREAFESLRPFFARVLAGEVVRHETQIDVPGSGLRWVNATYTPTYDASGRCDGWVAAVIDIDERKRMEEAIREARLEAEEANRAKDAFLATVSHELRSPLQGILGWLTLLKDGRLDAARTARALEAVERSVRLQAQLVHDIMDVSRIAAGKIELERDPVDLEDIVRTTIDEFLPDATAKRIAVEVVGEGCGLVLGDRERLHQVFSNLLGNALKFTPAGGSVTLACERDHEHAVVTVRDTGEGIDPDFLPKLFEPFLQRDHSSTRRHGGLGLGLAIVRHLVNLHGGTVAASSAGLGQGASFCVRLPGMTAAEQASQPPATDAPAPAPAQRLDGVHILLVDDDGDLLESMSLALEAAGAAVRTAGSAEEAWSVCREQTPDILVSDLGMPDADGYALLRRIRASPEGAVLPAVALTGFARAKDQERALEAGFAVHIAKPVDTEELVDAILRILGKGVSRG